MIENEAGDRLQLPAEAFVLSVYIGLERLEGLRAVAACIVQT